jgi:signal transduction histidine kinase
MMAYQWISFRTPWALVLLFLLLAGGIGTAGYFIYLDQKNGIRREKQKELLAFAELKSRTIAEWRSAFLDDAEVIFGNPLLLPLVERRLRNGAVRSSAEQELRQWITNRQRHYHYRCMTLMDLRGVPLISIPPGLDGDSLIPPRRSLLRQAVKTGKPVFSDIYRAAEGEPFRYETFIPLRDTTGGGSRIVAVMLIDADPGRTLFPLLGALPTASRTAEALLVRGVGHEVVYLNEPRYPRAAGLPGRSRGREQQVASAAVSGREGLIEGLDYRGVPVIAAVKGIPGSPWSLVIKMDRDELDAPVRDRARLLGGIVVVLFLATGMCVWLVWRQARLGFYRELYEAEREHRAAALEAGRELQLKQQELEALNRSLEERVREELERNREKDHILIQQGRLAAMGEMIGNIAHQWRQPLNVVGLLIQSLSEYSRNGELTEEHLEDTARHAMEVIGYMSRTMNDFRNFFRPDKEKTEFFIREVVERSISFIQPHFHYHDIEVKLLITDGLKANGYPNEYSQVLLNILGNAKDIFLERGTGRPAITIRAYEAGGRTVVSIADNAGGVPENILARIFDPYFTCKRSGDGTGLGLYISKTIIEKNMNGRLTARNNGSGAEFRIEV